MRPFSSALISFLLSGASYFNASLITIELYNGGTIYLTSADQPITYGGNVYQATGNGSNGMPALDVGEWSVVNTPDVPTCDIQFVSTGTDYLGGLNFKELVHAGLLRGAYVTISEVFMPTFGDVSLGAGLVFAGRAGPGTITATGVKLTVKADSVLMQQYMPKNSYQLGCIWSLFDANCQASRTAFTASFTVASPSGNSIFVPWATEPEYYTRFSQGILTITSGQAAGQIRTVQEGSATGAALAYPLDTLPAPGDSFTVSYGCDKTATTCLNVFNNLQNRRAFDFIPPAETAY